MSITRGDFVRPNNPGAGLPLGSVWRVVCTAGALKLEPENSTARGTHHVVLGCRFSPRNFDKVVLCRGQWVCVRDVVPLSAPDSFYDDVLPGRMSSPSPSPQNLAKTLFSSADSVATAFTAMEQASNAADAIESLLEAARKLEAERQQELREAKAAKAKADKEAAAKAKAEDAKRELVARLHADRCLGEATMELIAEVSRLNNGGAEQIAAHSIAAHIDQLQALAKSYGYRIAKPSMLAQVVKL